MFFVGETRFSLFEPRGVDWKLSRGARGGKISTDDYLATLFAEERLAPRASTFFKHTLPTLDLGRGEHDLRHLVHYSEELPQPYQDQLAQAAERYPWLVLCRQSGPDRRRADPHQVAREALQSSATPGGIYAHYRLDDDDVLGINYFDQIARYLAPPFVGMVVSLGFGVTAYYQDGLFLERRKSHTPKIAIGLTGVCELGADGQLTTPEPAPHTRTDRLNPVILDSRECTFLHTKHHQQDSATGKDAGATYHGDKLRRHRKMPKAGTDLGIEVNFPTVDWDASRGRQVQLPTADDPA